MQIDVHKYTQHVEHVENLWIVVVNAEGPTPSALFFAVDVDPIPPTFELDETNVNSKTTIRLKMQHREDGASKITYHTIIDPNAKGGPMIPINIFLPQHIVDQRDSICTLDLKIKKQHEELIIPINRIDACVQVDAAAFDDHDELEFCITHKVSSTEPVSSLKDLIMHSAAMDLIGKCIKHNVSNEFFATNQGRIECLDVVNQMISNVEIVDPVITASKNLVYFSVYFDKGYVELMNNSLMSILKHASVDFDVLIITDASTQKLIDQQPFTKLVRPKYHITPTPVDGVEASKNKTLIYDFEDVDMYDKILFLDCDVVAVGDVSEVFKVCNMHNTLYTARGVNITFQHHRTIHHGFDVVRQSFINEMMDSRQHPFNAGQFMFRNSPSMRAHFHNLNWFMQAWPGEYFFEQAFMCYYFCKAKITNDALNSKLALISTVVDNLYNLQDKILLHFTAPPLDAITKINYINNFIKKYYEQSITSQI
jgi:hypothetical protein